MNKNTKKNISGGIMILFMIAGLTIGYLWKTEYKFRRWSCGNFSKVLCKHMGNIPEELRRKEYDDWKRKNPGKT